MASLAIGSVLSTATCCAAPVSVDCGSVSPGVAFEPDVRPLDGLTSAARSKDSKGGVGVAFDEVTVSPKRSYCCNGKPFNVAEVVPSDVDVGPTCFAQYNPYPFSVVSKAGLQFSIAAFDFSRAV